MGVRRPSRGGVIGSAGRLLAVSAALCPALARGGVTITRVAVDGVDVAVPEKPAEGERPRLRIPAGFTSLEITYAGGWNAPPPPEPDAAAPPMARGMRLRHRLEGVDPEWRDVPAKARVFLQFVTEDGRILDSSETAVRGESPGWLGAPEVSPVVPQRLVATAPAGAARVTAHFLSHGGDEVVGQIGIDEVGIEIQTPGGATRRETWGFVVPASPPRPFDAPAGWTRRGSRGLIAQVRVRPDPTPHPILVLLDDAPDQYGNWSTAPALAVSPGDRVTLSWTSAHSLGVGGTARASYRDLAPGTYWFRAGAFRPGGEPTGHETSLGIEVVVPWHRRAEVWVGALAVGAGAAFLLARSLAVRRMRRRLEEVERAHALERERTRIARDLHDEIGAGLTEIAMQNFWVRREMEGSAAPATLDRIDRARESAVNLVRSVDAIVWAVNPANDTLDRFVPYLTHSVEQFLEAAGVPARIDVPEVLPVVPIVGTVRHGLFLAVREAVNNAVKHARPQQVWLTVRAADGRLRIVVEDDGCGLPAEKIAAAATGASDRSGLGNMRRRVEEAGGLLTLGPRPGGGTRVTIDVPLPA